MYYFTLQHSFEKCWAIIARTTGQSEHVYKKTTP